MGWKVTVPQGSLLRDENSGDEKAGTSSAVTDTSEKHQDDKQTQVVKNLHRFRTNNCLLLFESLLRPFLSFCGKDYLFVEVHLPLQTGKCLTLKTCDLTASATEESSPRYTIDRLDSLCGLPRYYSTKAVLTGDEAGINPDPPHFPRTSTPDPDPE